MAGITLVGAGALGQGFAGMLAAGGSTTLLARPSTAAALAEAGQLVIRVVGDELVTPIGDGPGAVRVISDPALIDPDDAIVFVTKGQHLDEVARQVAASWKPSNGFVLGLQNGVMKDAVLEQVFGADRVVGAATVLGARRADDGVITVTGLGSTYVGEFGGEASERLALLVSRWAAAGLPIRDDFDIARLLWTKCVNALGAFGIGCLGRLPANKLMQSEQYAGLFVDILHEGSLVAAAEGNPVDDFPDLPIATYLATPRAQLVDTLTRTVRAAAAAPTAVPSYSSMAQDVLAGRSTEHDAVFGDVVRRARRAGVEVPRLELIDAMIGGLDALLDVPTPGAPASPGS